MASEPRHVIWYQDGIDLWCGGTAPAPETSFYGEVNIVRQAASPGQSFMEIKAGIGQLESDEIINLGQAGSLEAKLGVAEGMYDRGEPLVARNILHAFQHELVGPSASTEPQWVTDPNWVFAPQYLLAESLIRVLTLSLVE